VDNFGDHESIHRAEANRLIEEGKFDQALVEIDKSLDLDPANFLGIWDRGNIYVYEGELEKAELEYQKLLTVTDPIIYSWGLAGLARLLLRQGKYVLSKENANKGIEKGEKAGEEAWVLAWQRYLMYLEYTSRNYEQTLIEAEKAWLLAVEEDDLSSKRQIVCFRGLIHLGLKDIDEAQRAEEELRKLCEEESIDPQGYYFHLRGNIELGKNEFDRAVESFEKALSFNETNILFLDSLALTHLRNGEILKALETYQKMASLESYLIVLGRNGYEDLITKSFYMLGKIYEQQGDTDKAIEHYEKFLDLWKDADFGLPEVEDARKRLAGLKSQLP